MGKEAGELNDMQFKCCCMKQEGMTYRQIAEKIRRESEPGGPHSTLHEVTIRAWAMLPAWKAEIERGRNETREACSEMATAAGLESLDMLKQIAQGIGPPLLNEDGEPLRYRNKPDGSPGEIRRQKVPIDQMVRASQTLVKLAGLEPAAKVEVKSTNESVPYKDAKEQAEKAITSLRSGNLLKRLGLDSRK